MSKSGAALHSACYAGDGVTAVRLLHAGADVHYVSKANRQTPLHQACIQGLLEAATLMVEKGARLDACDYYNRTPLEAARDLGHPEMVAPLLAAAGAGGAAAPAEVLRKKRVYRAGDDSLDYSRGR